MPKPIFPWYLDPRQMRSADELIIETNRHLALQESLVVQDNFLVSKLLWIYSGYPETNRVRELIERGWLRVALRDEVDSLVSLKQQLLEAAKKGEYLPFEDRMKGIELYESRDFEAYLADVDSVLDERVIVRWSRSFMASNYRDGMLDLAKEGPTGLSADYAEAIWNIVEASAVSSSTGWHTRTLYWKYANERADKEVGEAIKNWATFQYIQNLPDALDLGLSVPAKLLENSHVWNPLSELKAIRDETEWQTVKEACRVGLLFPEFLHSLSPASLEKLRNEPTFGELQKARDLSDPVAFVKALLLYLDAVQERGLSLYGPAHAEISKLEGQIRVMRWFDEAVGAIHVVVVQAPNALLAFIGNIFGRYSKAELEKRKKENRAELEAKRIKENVIKKLSYSHREDDVSDDKKTEAPSSRD